MRIAVRSGMSSSRTSPGGLALRLGFGFASSLILFVAAEGCSLDWTAPAAQPDGGSMIEASGDTHTAPDASTPLGRYVIIERTTVPNEAGAPPDAADDARVAPSDCDRDHDGYNDRSRAGCEDAPGPSDCDDADWRVHPGQSFLDERPGSLLAGDWSCTDGVEPLYPTNVSCSLLALGACAGLQGFVDNPGCGEEGTFVRCEVKGLVLCGVGSMSTRRQACK
jgi:hypothetical protein